MIDHMSGFGGAQRVIANLCNEAASQGNEVLLLMTGCKSGSVYPLHEKIQVFYTGDKCRKLKKFRILKAKIKAYNPTIIISFLTMVNVEACFLKWGTGIPLIISERNDPDYESKKEKRLSQLFYRLADAVVVQTDAIAKKIARYYHRNIYVIANPLVEHDIEKTDYNTTNKIIAVGRLNKQKNYPLMIDAFKDFHRKFGSYVLEIYGNGDLKEELQTLINAKQLSDCVFLKGNSTEVLKLETEADMYLMTSDFEGMPNALAEAMSLGMPCISTNCDGGGAAFLIDNEKNGVLVKKGNKPELVHAMEMLATDADLRMRIGNNAKKMKVMLEKNFIMTQWFKTINQTIG